MGNCPRTLGQMVGLSMVEVGGILPDRSDRAIEDLLEQMPMAVRLVFAAMAEHSDCLFLRQTLEQAQSELLPVVLDGWIARIHFIRLEQLGAIALAEPGPGHLALLKRAQQLLAWAEVRHPDVIAIRRQAAPAEARDEEAETVAGCGRRMNRTGLNSRLRFHTKRKE